MSPEIFKIEAPVPFKSALRDLTFRNKIIESGGFFYEKLKSSLPRLQIRYSEVLKVHESGENEDLSAGFFYVALRELNSKSK